MRRRRKKKGCVVAFLLCLTLLAVGAVGGAYLYLGTLVGGAVEAVGTRVTGVPVTVGAVQILPWSGEGEIRDVLVGAPDGFRAEKTLEARRVRVAVDLESIVDEEGPVIIRDVVVDGAAITYELTPRGSNLGQILDHVEAVARSERETPTGKGRRVVVQRFALRGAQVEATARVGEIAAGSTVRIPDIELRDIGNKSRGTTVYELALQIARPLRDKVAAAGLGAALPAVDVSETATKAAKAVEAGARKLGKQLRGLLGSGFADGRDAGPPAKQPAAPDAGE